MNLLMQDLPFPWETIILGGANKPMEPLGGESSTFSDASDNSLVISYINKGGSFREGGKSKILVLGGKKM